MKPSSTKETYQADEYRIDPFAPKPPAPHPPRDRDRLGFGWKLLFWITLPIPFAGLTVSILATVLSCSWRRRFPKKAASINRLGWLILLLNLMFCALLMLLREWL